MRTSKTLQIFGFMLLLVICTHANPLKDLDKIDTELSDLNAVANKTAVEKLKEDIDSVSDIASSSTELQPAHAYPHRDEDQLNTATNLVLAQNYKYDVEILESGDEDSDESKDSEEMEERFKGHGLKELETESFTAENIEMTPLDVDSTAISESHLLLSIILVVLALASVGLYAGLVIWRSHLEQRYGMRERLVNRDVDEEGIDDTDYHVYAPTTTPTTTRA
ncbi:uncharacterized protein [Drosophila tropicalis]|uniref:uncharacterized protein n=1 Tax=Drosophila tropicalis TaxID=46794 RepID=UPI0035ABE533